MDKMDKKQRHCARGKLMLPPFAWSIGIYKNPKNPILGIEKGIPLFRWSEGAQDANKDAKGIRRREP